MKEKEPKFQKPKFQWEHIGDVVLPTKSEEMMYRMAVPGGWLLRIAHGFSVSITFVADPEHKWEGTPLP